MLQNEAAKRGTLKLASKRAIDEIVENVLQKRPNWQRPWLRAALLRDVMGTINMPHEDYLAAEFWSSEFWIKARGSGA
ncbi:MAG: hypothetical protein IH991_01390 [Planctomycetes bacterium]|nr:hypothetical protein [Planctomycetota bacterium]